MKNIKILVICLTLLFFLFENSKANSWGFSVGGISFGYNSGGGGYCGGWGGAPYGPVYYPNVAPPGVYGGYGPGRSRGYVRRNCPTAYTSGWVVYPNVW